LARICHGGVKTNEDVIAKSLEGDYRPEHLFALRQSLAAFRYYQQLVLEADREIQLQLAELKTASSAQPTTPARTKVNAHMRATTSREHSTCEGTISSLRSGCH
jgi:hypothetical protein